MWQYPYHFYTITTSVSGLISMFAGTLTLLLIIRKPDWHFGVLIATCIALWGLIQISYALTVTVYGYACLDISTQNGKKYSYFLKAMNVLVEVHYWVFAIKYLETGLVHKQNFLTHEVKKKRLTRILMMVVYLPYFVTGFVAYIYLFITCPSLPRQANATPAECNQAYYNYSEAVYYWSQDTLTQFQDYAHPWEVATTTYYLLSTLVSTVGIVLIFAFNRRIVRQSSIKTKWSQYALHIVALVGLSATQLTATVHPNWKAKEVNGAQALINTFISVLLCFIVWSQSKLQETKCYIQELPDGRVRFTCQKGDSVRPELGEPDTPSRIKNTSASSLESESLATIDPSQNTVLDRLQRSTSIANRQVYDRIMLQFLDLTDARDAEFEIQSDQEYISSLL